MGVSTDAMIAFGMPIPSLDDRNYMDDTEESLWDIAHAMEKEFGVTMVQHCSGEYPMWFIAVADSVKRAHRGYLEVLDVPNMAAMDEQASEQKIHAAADHFHIELPKDSKVAWNLFSNWF